jgi:hypothetical protein
MKRANVLAAALALAAALSGCSRTDGDKAAETPKAGAPEKAGVTLDAATQERIGLSLETPAPAQWQPGLRVTGRAANPLAFIAAATDYETARTAAAASQSELARTEKLAAQENASSRVLEAARAAAARDALALAAARAKFAADWGGRLAAQTNAAALAGPWQSGDLALARLFLPPGYFPKPIPTAATIYIFSQESNGIPAELADDLSIDPATQAQTLLFSVKQPLPADAALVADLRTGGESQSGVVVPVGAVLRYEGRGWVYVQAGTNQFVRAEIPLDRLTAGGWFVAGNLSATNRIVVTGAQTVLSAELSGSGFNTGQRD